MKNFLRILAIAAAALLAGCGKPQVNAPAELQKGFAKSEPAIKEDVQKASAHLQSGNYVEAMQALDRAVAAQQTQNQPMDEQQKKAVGAAVSTARQAVEKNPKLNTPQLYKAMTDLIERAYGEN